MKRFISVANTNYITGKNNKYEKLETRKDTPSEEVSKESVIIK